MFGKAFVLNELPMADDNDNGDDEDDDAHFHNVNQAFLKNYLLFSNQYHYSRFIS